MSVTNSSLPGVYQLALNRFVGLVAQLGPIVRSAFVFGSLTRVAPLRPSTDILDASIIISDQAVSNYNEWEHLVELFQSCCSDLASIALPFHPFLYLPEAEAARYCSSFYYTHYLREAKVICGEPIAEVLGTTSYALEWIRLNLLSADVECQRYVTRISNQSLNELTIEAVRHKVASLMKSIPYLAALSLEFGGTFSEAAEWILVKVPTAREHYGLLESARRRHLLESDLLVVLPSMVLFCRLIVDFVESELSDSNVLGQLKKNYVEYH